MEGLMMELTDYYDSSSETSIEGYAHKLIGRSFREILNSATCFGSCRSIQEAVDEYGKKQFKGGLGNLVEKYYFGYEPNSNPWPDFPEAGVELKVTPFEVKRNGDYKAGERLVITMIEFDRPIESNFYESHLWNKCKRILLIYYHRDKLLKEQGSNLDYRIRFVKLFTPTKADQEIIRNDYKIIVDKIKAGLAHELSESDTMYLGACTKGATAASSLVRQFYGNGILAKRRAFCYKSSYMTFVLNHYVVPKARTSQSDLDSLIIKNPKQLEHETFENYIRDQINQYVGKTDFELCQVFDREYNNNKAQWIELAYRMLGIKSNRAEEFVKANIVVKAIRLNEKGKMKENSPLPAIHFKDILKEQWENSDLYNYFESTKFFFVVFKKCADKYILEGCQLWNMPYHDLEDTVHSEWQKVQDAVRDGIKFKVKQTKGGIVFENNLPKKSENIITHIRPHAQKRYYEFTDGRKFGNGSYADADQLPDGTWMPRQSFWLNNNYLLSILNEDLKN